MFGPLHILIHGSVWPGFYVTTVVLISEDIVMETVVKEGDTYRRKGRGGEAVGENPFYTALFK